MPGMPPVGAYVHIPFCAARCDYCAFATWTDRHHLIDRYLAAVRAEIAEAVSAGAGPFDTIFVGGGTPSLVPAEALVHVLGALPLADGAEVTVEANPDDVDVARLATYRRAGVTRISLGVQSMVPHVLRALGRGHDPDNVVDAVAAVREVGFESFNLDLIYGAVGETPADWAGTLDAALALEPPHVSAYALTVERGTPLATDARRHPDDDDQADKYLVADERFAAAGLGWYEISNWARPGHRCRHNLGYWRQLDYRGFGCAAHSHTRGRRWWNVRTPERYVRAVEARRDPEAGAEVLDDEARRREALQLSVRTADGVPEQALAEGDREDLAGLVVPRGGRLVLTTGGRLLANEVALRLG